ncbi:MAG: hypothetical protein ACP6IQ_01545 [Candidatus Njordarchaeia archaeon]
MYLNETKIYGARIGLRYATYINLVSKVFSYIASFIFTILIARKLSIEDFGIWTMILKYPNYLIPISMIYAYWLPRTVSRGLNTAKVGLFLAILLGSLATIVYVILIYGIYFVFEQPFTILILSAIIVIQEYLNKYLNGLSTAYKPQYIGISLLVYNVTQALLALFIAFVYSLNLFGVVIATIIARTLAIIIQFFANIELIKESRLDMNLAKDWLKKSWIPFYNSFVGSLVSLNVVLVRYITGNDVANAYYGVVTYITSIVLFSTQALPALYSKLLATRDMRAVEEIFWIMFMLAIPTSVGILLYTEPIIALYSVKYVIISSAVRVFAITTLFQLLLVILRTVLRGYEWRDLENFLRNKYDMKRTVLVKGPSFRLLSVIIYLALLALASLLYSGSPEQLIFMWSFISLTRIIIEIYFNNRLIKKEFNVHLPYKKLGKFLIRFFIASSSFVVVKIFYSPIPKLSIYELIGDLVPILLILAILYFGILYLIDPKMRETVKITYHYIRKKPE